ncbi:MAG: sensor domain-containing diguanylate cyclase [Christensenellaceae bacterium]|jgi:diguanylate cyclase (GGDEF)-like protein/PAS domain S-box-containing protein|nr:sensor domain-containing diguanylate cyclase [Christensenellaceae bacterium]
MTKNIKIAMIFHSIATAFAIVSRLAGLITSDIYVVVQSLIFAGATTCAILFSIRERTELDSPILELVRNYIPGGYVEFYFDEKLTIRSYTPGILRHMGYIESDFEKLFNNSFLNAVAPDDRTMLLERLKSGAGALKSQQIRFRVLSDARQIMPVVALITYNFSFVKNAPKKSHLVVRCLLVDFSSVKSEEADRSLEAERYKIVAEQSDDIVFDYNVRDRILFLNNLFEKKFGYKIMPTTDLRTVLAGDDAITSHDDAEKLIALISSSEVFNELNLRIKKFDGSFIWCKLTSTAIYGADRKPYRLIGKIVDIDVPVKEKEILLEKTLRDSLTGLYNKVTTESVITECLQTSPTDSLYAFVLLDIDNFKYINDNFGHICGDRVLGKIATNISALFRSSDIIGRVGGDEFVVLIRDLPNEAHAIKKTAAMLSSIYSAFSLENEGFTIAASAGIAFFAKHGTTYLELFDKADAAMYKVKNSGKNAYAVYDNTTPSIKKVASLARAGSSTGVKK